MVYCVIMTIVLFLVKSTIFSPKNLATIVMMYVSATVQYYNHGEVRLVGGTSPNKGRVEVFACTSISCSWGPVCGNGWDDEDAQVICRQLGYRSESDGKHC